MLAFLANSLQAGIILAHATRASWYASFVCAITRVQRSLAVIAQPPHVTFSAFVRASTLSLGSIAFGSLIVTLLDILRLILNAVRNNADQNGHRKLSRHMH